MNSMLKIIIVGIPIIAVIYSLIMLNNQKDNIPTINSGLWGISEFMADDSEKVLVRNRTDAIDYKEFFSFQVGISFKVNDHLNDTSNINLFEENIIKMYEANKIGILTTVITGSDFKEYVIYVNSDSLINEQIAMMKTEFEMFDITFYSKKDKSWSLYNSFK